MAICPRCGADGSGNFCSACGASLKQRACPSCGETPELGARFCNHCGATLGAAGAAGPGTASGAGGGGSAGARTGGGASRAAREKAGVASGDAKQSQTGWIVAGVFFVAMILIVALPILRREPPAPDAPVAGVTGGSGAPGTGTPPDLSQMTPREAADLLWNRIVEANEKGDSAQVEQFMPMALQAFEMAAPLDLDGLYHVAFLHQTAGDYSSAMRVAREMLDQSPTYLLGLAAAADAARAMGDTATARQHYARFLEVYDSEMAKNLEEYRPSPEGHGYILTQARQNAVAATGP